MLSLRPIVFFPILTTNSIQVMFWISDCVHSEFNICWNYNYLHWPELSVGKIVAKTTDGDSVFWSTYFCFLLADTERLIFFKKNSRSAHRLKRSRWNCTKFTRWSFASAKWQEREIREYGLGYNIKTLLGHSSPKKWFENMLNSLWTWLFFESGMSYAFGKNYSRSTHRVCVYLFACTMLKLIFSRRVSKMNWLCIKCRD